MGGGTEKLGGGKLNGGSTVCPFLLKWYSSLSTLLLMLPLLGSPFKGVGGGGGAAGGGIGAGVSFTSSLIWFDSVQFASSV